MFLRALCALSWSQQRLERRLLRPACRYASFLLFKVPSGPSGPLAKSIKGAGPSVFCSELVGKRRESLCTAEAHCCRMQACMWATMAWLTVQVDAPEDVDVPQHLLAPEEVEQLFAERQPRFVPLARYGPGADSTPPADSATGAPDRATLPCCHAVLSSVETFPLVDATGSMLRSALCSRDFSFRRCHGQHAGLAQRLVKFWGFHFQFVPCSRGSRVSIVAAEQSC